MRKLIILFCVIFFIGCASKQQNKAKQGIVSLAPNITEIIYALGEENQLTGVTRYCNYPEAAKTKKKIGDYLNPDIEKIVLLNPEIILSGTWKNNRYKEKLLELGYRIKEFKEPHNIFQAAELIQKIGKYINASKKAEELADEIRRTYLDYRKKNSKKKRLRVYVEVDYPPSWTLGKKSFINDILLSANFDNIFKEYNNSYFQVQDEEIIRQNPDLIIVLWTTELKKFNRDDLATLSAVKNNRIIYIKSKDMYLRAGPRIIDAIKDIDKIRAKLDNE